MKRITCLLSLFCLVAAASFSLSETLVTVGYKNENDFEFLTVSDTRSLFYYILYKYICQYIFHIIFKFR